MAKRTSLIPAGSEPDFSGILSADIPARQKRESILKGLGIRGTRAEKYKTPEAKKEAQRRRSKARRAKERKILERYGIAPQPRKKLSVSEKKFKQREYRRKRAANHNEFMKKMARDNPELARQFHIDVSKFKVKID